MHCEIDMISKERETERQRDRETEIVKEIDR